MSESTLTPHTAPRTVEGLSKETPFKLRLLVQTLGGMETAEQKMAWHDAKTPEARATYVLQLLKNWDEANPGAATSAPAAPAPAPHMNGAAQPLQTTGTATTPAYRVPPVQLPTVDPSALTAAAAALADTKPRRSPKTSTETPEPAKTADVGTDVVNLLNRLAESIENDKDRFKALEKKVITILDGAASAKSSRLEVVENKYNELHKELGTVLQYLSWNNDVQKWTLMALLTFMQESVGTSPKDALGMAISDSAADSFQKLVDEATGTPGKG